MSNEGLKSLDEIWDSIDMGDGPSDDFDGGQEIDEQVEPGIEQSDSEEFVPAKLSDLYAEDDEDGQGAEGTPVDLDQEITLPDGQVAKLRDLYEGNLRHGDYTRKTQELATLRQEFESERESFNAERAALEATRNLRDALLENPVAVVADMASKLGIIDEDTAEYASRKRWNGDASKLLPDTGKRTDEVDIEALIEQKAAEKLEELMKNSPVAKEIEMAQARQQVDNIFGQIEKVYNTTLDQADRAVILQASLDMNQDNLEYVYLKLNSELAKRQAGKARVKSGQQPRGSRGSQPNDADIVTEPPKTLEEAWSRIEKKFA